MQKVALVTGGGKGLGKGFVDYLVDNDVIVYSGVREHASSHTLGNPNLRIVELDVTNDAHIMRAVQRVEKEVGYLTYLVNNAGVNKDTATQNNKKIVCNLPDLDRASLLKMFDVNAVSPLMVLQKFLPLLAKTDSFVINISSARASYHDEYENSSGNYGYRSSKAALNMMTYACLFDLPNNVKTFCLHPGDVRSEINKEGTQEPYEQAKHIMDISNNWNDKLNGQFLRYDKSYYPL